MVVREIKLTADEERIKLKVKNRKAAEKAKLFILRIVTFSVSFGILCIGWAGVVAIEYYETVITNYFNDIYIVNYIVRTKS